MDFGAVPLNEFLKHDVRPTFVLDLDNPGTDKFNILWQNVALESKELLLQSVKGEYHASTLVISWTFKHAEYFQWAMGGAPEGESTTFLFQGYAWSRCVVRGQWVIVSGTLFSEFAKNMRTKASKGTYEDSEPSNEKYPPEIGHAVSSLSFPTILNPSCDKPISAQHVFDWTRIDIKELDEHLQYARTVDWKSTELGDPNDWPDELRIISNLVMADPNPALVCWGEGKVMIYNSEYARIISTFHPCMGQPILEAMPGYCDYLVGIFDDIRTGRAILSDDLPMFMSSDGHMVEDYFDLAVVEFLRPSRYSTFAGKPPDADLPLFKLITYGRLDTLMDLAVKIATARSIDEFWALTVEILKADEKDIMLAMIYTHDSSSSEGDSNQDVNDMSQLLLRGSFGIPTNHPTAMPEVRLNSTESGLERFCSICYETGRPVVLHREDGTLPPELLANVITKDFGEECRAVVISPLRYDTSLTAGYIAIGINPRTALDDRCSDFIEAIVTLISTALGSLRQLVKREAKQAEISRELTETKLKVVRTEKLMRLFVERSPLGVFIAETDGTYVYRNTAALTSFSHETHTRVQDVWGSMADPEWLPMIYSSWAKLTEGNVPVTYEIKCKSQWRPQNEETGSPSGDDGQDHRVWLQVTAFPVMDSELGHVQIYAGVTDISALKWANEVQEKMVSETLESKKRLESFIDSTNHELRNPLSAILLASEDIVETVSSIVEIGPGKIAESALLEDLDSVIDNRKVVLACAKHQKRIVDDVVSFTPRTAYTLGFAPILSASKLDSQLMDVYPVLANPEKEIRTSLKIFQKDAAKADVQFHLVISERYRELAIEQFMFNTTRFTQISINLITNAIKFTKYQAVRKITITLDACEKPQWMENCEYYPMEETQQDPTTRPEDTGKGMTQEDRQHLFTRFAQASPKTHIQYGSSGLGLYISRRLAGLQGGAIGLNPQTSHGCTFAFFIKARAYAQGTHQPNEQRQSVSSTSSIPFVGPQTLPARPNPPPLLRSLSSHTMTTLITRTQPQESPSTTALATSPAQCRMTPRTTPVLSPGSGVAKVGMKEPNAKELTVLIVEDNLINQKMLSRQLQKVGCKVLVANHGQEGLEQIQNSAWASNPLQPISIVLLD
ncbi:hypothetical protein BT63DRAFT_479137 [Microthyrium microscopicum]|uniref:Histidine kinase domain-containing protein n=1 Tax=Microthyrium microscopicum TaxID=703497 RepID=A0A6A6UD26_9PEZI|nr:hypothetical protein BT63DRAFT_479137 [Microthyrium microscopicum]